MTFERKPNKFLIELKKDLKNWENWLDGFRISEEHKCAENNEYYDIAILRVSCVETNSPYYWIAARAVLADEKWVYDGEAERVGEFLDSSFYVINYCPYCGKKLMKIIEKS